MSELFVYRSLMPACAEAVYRWHAEPETLSRLTPPWEKAHLVARTGGIEQPGTQVKICVRVGPFQQLWIAEHRACEPGRMFRDILVEGPFPRWEHTHLFLPEDHDGHPEHQRSWLEDRVEYDLPLGWLGRLFVGAYLHKRLERLFAWRHHVTAEAVAMHQK